MRIANHEARGHEVIATASCVVAGQELGQDDDSFV